jgi:hypothetical protein
VGKVSSTVVVEEDYVDRFIKDSIRAIKYWARKSEELGSEFHLFFRPDDVIFLSLLDYLMTKAEKRGYDICLSEAGSKIIAHTFAYGYHISEVEFDDIVEETEMKLYNLGVREEEIGECIETLVELKERLRDRIRVQVIEGIRNS